MTSMAAVLISLVTAPASPQGEVLNFSATWCGPCREMAPIVENLKRKGYPIRKIDVDAQPELASKYQITSIPQFVLVIDGEVQQRIVRPASSAELIAMMSRIPREAPSDVQPTSHVETSVATANGPTRRRGIPIPFLGKQDSFDPDEVNLVRGQSDISTTETGEAGPISREPMDASVRLKVTQQGAQHNGSGTIVHSTADRTYIITCGHLFRNSDQKTRIDVDVMVDGKPQTFPGQLIRFDDQADVGLIAISAGKVFPASPVAEDPQLLQKNDIVYSVGCGNGELPEKWQMFAKGGFNSQGHSITECSQAPIPGRSGGGLFNRRGELIGVCMAADKKSNTGLYAGLTEIHKMLDASSLTTLYRDPSAAKPEFKTAEASPESTLDPSSAAPFPEEPQHAANNSHADKSVSTASKPIALSDTEVDAIAAALQFAGPRGVTVKINASESTPEGYRVVIVTRGLNDQPALASNSMAAKPRTPAAEIHARDLEWENHLEVSHRSDLPAVLDEAPLRNLESELEAQFGSSEPFSVEPRRFQRTVQ